MDNRRSGRRSTHRCRRGRGIAAIEALALLPVFLLLLLGIIELTRMLWTRAILAHAARETVRIALVHGKDADTPFTANELRNRFIASTRTIDPNALQVVITPDWATASSRGATFRVRASYEYPLLWDVLGAPSVTLEVYAQSSVTY